VGCGGCTHSALTSRSNDLSFSYDSVGATELAPLIVAPLAARTFVRSAYRLISALAEVIMAQG